MMPMKTTEQLKLDYIRLGNTLETDYPELNFKNHCYWRIALDHVVGDKWGKIIARPAYKGLSEQQLEEVTACLERYRHDKSLLMTHNRISLSRRK